MSSAKAPTLTCACTGAPMAAPSKAHRQIAVLELEQNDLGQRVTIGPPGAERVGNTLTSMGLIEVI